MASFRTGSTVCYPRHEAPLPVSRQPGPQPLPSSRRMVSYGRALSYCNRLLKSMVRIRSCEFKSAMLLCGCAFQKISASSLIRSGTRTSRVLKGALVAQFLIFRRAIQKALSGSICTSPVFPMPVRPNPSLHPTCYSGLRPL
jgi:hypothetical protein